MGARLRLSEILKQIQKNWPEADSPENDLHLALIRLNDLVLEQTYKVVADHDLTPASFEALVTLRAQPAPRWMTPTELYRTILITSGGMTKVLGQLEADGLITRAENPGDQRSCFVCLTEAGQHRAEEVMEAVSRQEEKILRRSLAPAQIRQVGQVLLQMVADIEAS